MYISSTYVTLDCASPQALGRRTTEAEIDSILTIQIGSFFISLEFCLRSHYVCYKILIMSMLLALLIVGPWKFQLS